MQRTKSLFLAVAITLGAFPWFLPSIGEAQVVVNVDCDTAPPGSLNQAVNSANPFTTIFVTGTCREPFNVNFRAALSNIVLDGQNLATIVGQTPAGALSNIAVALFGAREITIKRFTIDGNGTSDGIGVNRGATAVIDSNIIKNTARDGIFVSRLGFAVIINNTIQDGEGEGIEVTENSAARIGHSSFDDATTRPNTIQRIAGSGISVFRSSNARIVGNTISGNGRDGVRVFKGSHADIASNNISGNGGDGISVSENSGVNLGSAVGAVPPIFTQPNSTTELNSGFGIRCSIGGYANGDLGTLTGNRGAKRFDKSCIKRLSEEVGEED